MAQPGWKCLVPEEKNPGERRMEMSNNYNFTGNRMTSLLVE